MNQNKCQKCEEEMEEGVIATPTLIAFWLAKWGTKINSWGSLENKKNMGTLRCKNCGYLENYAK